MSFSENDVKRIADLARLDLTQEEIQRMTQQVGTVLQYIDQLKNVDTAVVEPLYSPFERELVMADDEMVAGPGAKAMVKVSSEEILDHYKVPQVIQSHSNVGGGE